MKKQSTEQLIRRADELVTEQTQLVAELQRLKLEIVQRSWERLQLHKRNFKRQALFK